MKDKQTGFIEDVIGKIKIVNTVIITPDERYLTIVEIAPINFSYKTKLEQENIIDYFGQYTKVAPVKFKIKTLSRRANTNAYINVLNRDFQCEKSKKIKPYQDEYIHLIRQLGLNSGISRRFFVILEAVDTDTMKVRNIEDAIYQLDKARNTIRKYIRNCGTSVIVHDNEADFVLNTLYEFLNKNKSVYELAKKKQEFFDNAVEHFDSDEEELDKLDLPITSLLAPKKMEFFKDYCVIDGVYYSFFYMSSSNYPLYVSSAWLSGIICGGEGIDVDIFLEKKNTKVIKTQLRRRLNINKARRNSMKNVEGENFEEITNSLASSEFIKERLSAGENFFYISILFSISGNSFDEMHEKYAQVREYFESNDISLAECNYNIKQAFQSYLPYNEMNPTIYNKAKRNITTSGLSSTFPFTSYEVSDNDGVLLGISENQTMVIADNFDTSKYQNANISLLGTSGAGKTFTLQILCMRFRLKNIQTFVIAPKKGDEFERACTALDGEFITLSSGSKSRINILEIRPFNEENAISIGFKSKENKQSILSKKIDSLLAFFSLAIGEMTNEERTLLDEAILSTYASKGITKDNNSLVKKTSENFSNGKLKKMPIYKEMPIMEDLWNQLKKNTSTQRLANIIARYVTGSASAFNGQTNVDLDNKYIVFDLTDLSEELKPVGMFMALDYIWDKTKEDKTQKKIIAIDEAWMLISKNAIAANFVVEIFKTIRGVGGAAIAATQDINDFFSLENGKYGKAIINNSKIKMILKLEEDEAKMVQEKFNLSDNELKSVVNFHRGQILVSADKNTFSVSFKASRKETLLVTTDRNILSKMSKNEFVTDDDLVA